MTNTDSIRESIITVMPQPHHRYRSRPMPPPIARLSSIPILSSPTQHPSVQKIHALLQQTNAALDKIVKIRESMESHVDFSCLKKPFEERSTVSLERSTNSTSSLSSMTPSNQTIDRDSTDSLFSDSHLPPLKEARVERLTTIPTVFYEGLPISFYMALSRFLYVSVEIKTRHVRFNFYKDTFIGSDAIRMILVNGFAIEQSIAQRYGHVLIQLGYIEHVSRTEDQLHNHKQMFYRFTNALEYDNSCLYDTRTSRSKSLDQSFGIEYDFSHASDEVHTLVTDEVLKILVRVLHCVFERKNKLLLYKNHSNCFLGVECVRVIRELRITTSLIDAVLVGQALLDEEMIQSVGTDITSFQDKCVFYQILNI